MSWGLVARADNTGLGNLTWEIHRHLSPDRTVVIDVEAYRKQPTHPERYPGATWQVGLDIDWTDRSIREFLDGLDVVFTAETPYNPNLFSIAREMGVKSVLYVMPELFPYAQHPDLPRPDLYVNPTHWLQANILDPKIVLPLPVDRERCKFRLRTSANGAVDHLAGRPALLDRNGTKIVADSAPFVRGNVRIRAQTTRFATSRRTANLTSVHDEIENYWEQYDDVDLMVMPRRYGGLCMPVQEAASCGVPVILPDVEPYNEHWPRELLVPTVIDRARPMAGGIIPLVAIPPRRVADTINRLLADDDLMTEMSFRMDGWAEARSWEVLEPWWRSILV
jgi:glycosyltransferase involved in cell wall biosynthesis